MTLPDYLHGAIDLHVHSKPDIDARRYDDIDLAKEAAAAGMGAVLIKSHQSCTAERAYLVSRVVPGVEVYGGIVLNAPVGGLNPSAVRVALQLGAREVWMPTRSAANHRRHLGQTGGLSILSPDGALLTDVVEIVSLVREAGCILGSGHLSPEEVFALAEHISGTGAAPTLLITHPEWSVTYYSLEAQRKLAAYGNVFFERCFVSMSHRCGFTPFAVIADAIAAIGVDTTVLSTDLGQPDTPPPAAGLRLYAEQLHAAGFSVDDLHRMMQANPRAILERQTLDLMIASATLD
jgi:hypothetical protein